MKNFIRKTAVRTVSYYTLLTVSFAFVMLAMYAGSEEGVNISAGRTLLFLPFSVCFAVANTLLGCERPNPIGRWLLHCILTVIPGYFCIILPATSDTTGSERLIGFVIVLVFYLISLLVVALIRKRIKSIRAKEAEYR